MRPFFAGLLLSSSLLAPAPAMAQAPDTAEMQRQLAAMQAEIARLTAQVTELQARQTAPGAAPAVAPTARVATATPPVAAPEAAAKVDWKGAPALTGPNGFSFKPRGRMQFDTVVIDAPAALPVGDSLGFATEVRRAYIGFDGTLPGGFGYRAEIDVANSSAEITDLYLTYKASPRITLTLGQQKPFWGLDEMTSDLFTPFMERAAFNSAFGFERRVGFSGAYANKALLVQVGAFTDNAADLNSDSNNSYSIDGRVVLAPKLGDGVLHIGGSAHFRELNDSVDTVRYRARPFLHATDRRLVDTMALSATGERSFGGELAYIDGPFHATVESHRLTVRRPGLPDPTFWGGYAEIGMLLTRDDVAAYKNGAWDRVKPAHPLDKGGIGAIQVNLRYDKLDLESGPVIGGRQDTASLSLIWMPTDFVRVLANYGHLWIADAPVTAAGDPDYQVDTFGMRAQVDF
jgi:phosphate-selective porin OprO/OprP